MRQPINTKLAALGATFALALGGASVAWASHGADDPPGDDHGVALEPGDDNGGHGLEPGDDHGVGVEPGDDRGAARA